MSNQPDELHILLIEDNSVDAELVRDYLEDVPGRRFLITHMTALAQALERLPDDDVDLIVSDLNLPDSRGIGTIHQIHRAAPRTPVVVLSGVADDELGQRAIHAGAQDFLHKDALDASSLARSLRYASERGRLQSQLRSLVENNADAIVVVSRNGVVTFINRAAEALFGRSRQEFVGETFGYPVSNEGIAEIELRRSDDDVRAAEMRVACIDWEGQPAWLATIRDITDRKRAEELQRHLQHADRLASIGQLASGVAHEINNPAGFVYGNLQVMEEQLQRIERALESSSPGPVAEHQPELRATLGDMRRMLSDNLHGIERISRIVKGLSTFSRIERDEIELVDINEILDIACTMTSNEIRHRASLHRVFGQVPRIAADRGKLAQVFTNLLINAAHAIEAGEADRNRIRVMSSAVDTQVLVRIEDTGCGIPDDILDKIFAPFYTTKPRGQGTGLGLALSADIIRKHGGDIRVTSEVGRGTCFEVRLPRDTGMALSSPPPRPKPAPQRSKRARVLAIDDEVMLLESLRRMLRRTHEVVLAEGGAAAVAELEKDAGYDVVICDLMMPELDGMRFYEIVTERWPALTERIVYCSGGAFTSDAKDFIAALNDKNPVIEKPVTQRMLLDTVQRVLDRHGPRSE